MQITITKSHFFKAISVPWDTTTCIVSQAVAEAVGEEISSCGSNGAVTKSRIYYDFHQSLGSIISAFDNFHGSRHSQPAEDVLNQLPFTFEIKKHEEQ